MREIASLNSSRAGYFGCGIESGRPGAHQLDHYGKIVNKDDMHHCHLNKGRPRYVAVWKVLDRTVQLMEIKYVGTHENTDYRRIN